MPSPYTLKYLKQAVSNPCSSLYNLQYCSPINFCKAYGLIGFNLCSSGVGSCSTLPYTDDDELYINLCTP